MATAAPRALRARGRAQQRALRRILTPQVADAATATRPVARPASVHRRHFLARHEATAEAGLGTTVFGLLGLIALPVGLIGLAFGGGLVWGVIAAAGGLAVLAAYLDPFGG
ncbi:hypothetical protein [Hymenobacter terrenus]|uniref:hypothetical protein n=1 Tax=Hymenobacter terrenus TaxID=1629124 RepID=UPI0012E05425|nr:hypothetical protein [Hymenobacter terrenus]